MRKIILILAALCASIAFADPVTGKLAVAGLNLFNNNSITFEPPAVILHADGTLGIMDTAPMAINMINVPSFATETGNNLFTWTNGTENVHMLVTSFIVEQDSTLFLNILGRATLFETGFTPTPYAFSFSSTRPDGTTSYSMDLAMAPAVVSEPAPLILVGIALGLAALGAFALQRRKRFVMPL